MTKEDLKTLYHGDVLKVSIPGFFELPEARIVRFEDYDKDGNPDAVYVIGKQVNKTTDSFIVVKPERCEFIRHDEKIQGLIDNSSGVSLSRYIELESQYSAVCKKLGAIEQIIKS